MHSEFLHFTKPCMKKLALWFTTLCTLNTYAQEENWDTYLANYDGKPGTTIVDMGIKVIAPIAKFPFALITGVKYKNCDKDGFPSASEFDKLYIISDTVAAKLKALSPNRMAGTFTYDCERLDYYYLADTVHIRKVLTAVYESQFKGYSFYINITVDKKWTAYLEFLYPNDETREYMSNQKILIALSEAGDKLESSRKVDHWAYFKTEKDRSCFIEHIKKMGFKVEEATIHKKTQLPYKLQFSRNEIVELVSITKITLELRTQAIQCNGDYDGWETFVVK